MRDLEAAANSWEDIAHYWDGNPLYEQVCQEHRNLGSYGHSHMITDFVDRLIEKQNMTQPDEKSYYNLCLKYEIDPGYLGAYIEELQSARDKYIEILKANCVEIEIWKKLVKVLDEVQPGWQYEYCNDSTADCAMKVIGKLLAKANV